jgi:hypothetical protein
MIADVFEIWIQEIRADISSLVDERLAQIRTLPPCYLPVPDGSE